MNFPIVVFCALKTCIGLCRESYSSLTTVPRNCCINYDNRRVRRQRKDVPKFSNVPTQGRIENITTYNELSENQLSELYKEENLEESETFSDDIQCDQSKSSLTSLTAFDEPDESEEIIERGSIPKSTYFEYWRSGTSSFTLFILFFSFIIAQIVTNSSDLWLTHWTNVEAKRYVLLMSENISNPIHPQSSISTTVSTFFTTEELSGTLKTSSDTSFESSTYFIWIYSILILAAIVILMCRSYLYFKVCMNSSKALHSKMFRHVLEAPMRFFNLNSSGRILNRFSKDMGAVDEIVPGTQMYTIQTFLVMIGILTMVFIITPWMMIPAAVLIPVFYYFRMVYLCSAQSIKRLEGVAKSSVFSHVTATLQGITTIRSSRAENMLAKELDILQDQHTSAWVLSLVSGTTFGFYLDVMCCSFVTLIILYFLLFSDENTESGNVGLVISQSIILTTMLQFGIRQSAEVANYMVSVERILQYTKLEKERSVESESTKKLPKNWPDKGKVVFKNVFLQYDFGTPFILKNINIVINSGEKIGVVGRTGAGKTSLIAALFRLAPTDGTISIDEVDTSEITLNDLRSSISIIPQEPVLFSASVRYNLDPFTKHNDEVLWQAIEDVKLKDAITDLNQEVSEGGSNFSVGQRQLICLARAIIRNNKVLVMDEATANVDPQTDLLIQQTIREKFKGCTVITIAHRLHTIMDSDRVMVMKNGEVIEFGHPFELLQLPDGYFSKMVRETGKSMEETLKDVAKQDYIEKS